MEDHKATHHVHHEQRSRADPAVEGGRQEDHARSPHEAQLPTSYGRAYDHPVPSTSQVELHRGFSLHLLESACRRHSHHREPGRRRLHHHLHFHHRPERGHPSVHDLCDGEVHREHDGGAEGGEDPDNVLRGGDAQGPLVAVVEGEEDGTKREEEHAVQVGEVERLADENNREEEIDGELGGEDERGGGHREVGDAPGDEQVVDTEEEADEDAKQDEAWGEGGAGWTRGEVYEGEEEREAGTLDQGGDPPAGAAMHEVEAREEAGSE